MNSMRHSVEPDGARFVQVSSIAAIVAETIRPCCGERRSGLGTVVGMLLFPGYWQTVDVPSCASMVNGLRR
jgi:hypothetical protein